MGTSSNRKREKKLAENSKIELVREDTWFLSRDAPRQRTTMADDLEEYDMEQDKFMPGKGGKGRSKLEASTHTNHHDPSGQTRKIVTKMQNTEKNRCEAGGEKGPAQKKVAAPGDED